MPRRRELKSVAHGLAGSFVSRNNDVGGFWAIGKLFSLAARNDRQSVELDLVGGRVVPPDKQFDEMAKRYAGMLRAQMAVRNLREAYLLEATVTVGFDTHTQRARSQCPDVIEYLTTCRVELRDDLGNLHVAEVQTWSHEHDPEHELRSTRAPGTHSDGASCSDGREEGQE